MWLARAMKSQNHAYLKDSWLANNYVSDSDMNEQFLSFPGDGKRDEKTGENRNEV